VTDESTYYGINMARKEWKMPEEVKKEIMMKSMAKLARPQSATKKAEQQQRQRAESMCEPPQIKKSESHSGTPTKKKDDELTPKTKTEGESPKAAKESAEKVVQEPAGKESTSEVLVEKASQ